MVSYPGARLRTTSFQVSLLPLLWSRCLKLQQKKSEEDLQKEKVDQWAHVRKSGISNQDKRKKGKEGKTQNGVTTDGKSP